MLAPLPRPTPGSLQRHDLVCLSPAGWDRLRTASWPDSAAACLAHWAAHDLPLVVTRQLTLPGEDNVCLGLPAPQRWQRQRLALRVAPEHLSRVTHFPLVTALHPLLAAPLQAPWRALCAQLAAVGVVARVHGSFGWQRVTGLDHVRDSSDLDLLLAVATADQADQVVHALHQAPWPGPRLDGELIFPDGSGVAWREWPVWRAGLSAQLLVKRRAEVVLETGDAWLHRACSRAATPP